MSLARNFSGITAFCCAFVLVSSLALAQDGSPTAKCTFARLNIPVPGGSTTAAPADMNDANAIVGNYSDSNSRVHGFLFVSGRFTSFMFPGSTFTSPAAISNKGVIVGEFSKADGLPRGFAVSGGAFREIKLPGHPTAIVRPAGVNGLGDIVGSFTENSVASRGFILRGSKVTVLSFPGAAATFVRSVNVGGIAVGDYQPSFSSPFVRAFQWHNGVYTDISFPGAAGSLATKISDTNDVVGIYNDANRQTHGYSLDKGRFTQIDIPVTNPSGPPTTELLSVNNKDQVLGLSVTPILVFNAIGQCSSVF